MVDFVVYGGYEVLKVMCCDYGVFDIVMSGEGVNCSGFVIVNVCMYCEFVDIWCDVDCDFDMCVVVICGEGKGFLVGGDFVFVEDMVNDFDVCVCVWCEVCDFVYNVINCSKLIVLVMYGLVVGVGFVVGLFVDILIVVKDVCIIDGYMWFGVVVGDYVVIVWLFLCGMVKVKYYLMLCEFVSGEEVEWIGLVLFVVELVDLLLKVYEVVEWFVYGL